MAEQMRVDVKQMVHQIDIFFYHHLQFFFSLKKKQNHDGRAPYGFGIMNSKRKPE